MIAILYWIYSLDPISPVLENFFSFQNKYDINQGDLKIDDIFEIYGLHYSVVNLIFTVYSQYLLIKQGI